MASFKSFMLLGFLAGVSILINGCAMTMTNLTMRSVPENASEIYTLTLEVGQHDGNIIPESVKPMVVIDGMDRPMHKVYGESQLYAYDYSMPLGRQSARYYFYIDYDIKHPGKIVHHQIKSEVFELDVINRYVLSLESTRGPVGSTGTVIGRGFSPYDQILFNGRPAPTHFHSPNVLGFTVPPLPAGRSYEVSVNTGKGVLSSGSFMIDSAFLRVMPMDLNLVSGERSILVFSIDCPAPRGGLTLDITTNVPQSVIMHEARIPEGTRSISVPLEAGIPGSGAIFVSASGFKEIQVPVKVTGNVVEVMEVDSVIYNSDNALNFVNENRGVNAIIVEPASI
jgi:hypothetical protein